MNELSFTSLMKHSKTILTSQHHNFLIRSLLFLVCFHEHGIVCDRLLDPKILDVLITPRIGAEGGRLTVVTAGGWKKIAM